MSKKGMWDKYREFINYSAVGISLTVFNWLLYAAAVKIFDSIMMANVVSWSVTVVLAYLGNKAFVFECSGWELHTVFREFLSYLGARGATGLLEIGALPMLYQMGMRQQLFGVRGMAAKVAVSLMVMVLNYLCSRFLVFRQQDDENGESFI